MGEGPDGVGVPGIDGDFAGAYPGPGPGLAEIGVEVVGPDAVGAGPGEGAPVGAGLFGGVVTLGPVGDMVVGPVGGAVGVAVIGEGPPPASDTFGLGGPPKGPLLPVPGVNATGPLVEVLPAGEVCTGDVDDGIPVLPLVCAGASAGGATAERVTSFVGRPPWSNEGCGVELGPGSEAEGTLGEDDEEVERPEPLSEPVGERDVPEAADTVE